ncbi:MAG: bifunctional diaminohydroxyphosphoribosylaminopyrimidine deaminase/5-amino-6-(5-phosphoribosylamino)uracil reductase RibD [Gammaproteobacteria bacterium]
MPDFSAEDYRLMARALSLARRGLSTTHPNPRVGCVIARHGLILGEAWHRFAGEPHAEVLALKAAGERARGATCYVNLEPCCYHGKTPACTEALIRAGVARVVAAMLDPNSRVNGHGFRALEQAGIPVQTGVLAEQAAALNRGFIKRMQHGLPFVTSKIAISIDGRVALHSGASQWITSDPARADVQRLRAQSSAVMTGIGTVLADDPLLTVRSPFRTAEFRQPVRVVLDSRLRFPGTAKMLSEPGRILVLTGNGERDKSAAGIANGAEIIVCTMRGERLDLESVLNHLGRLELNEILVEAGPTLNGALLQARLVDEIVIYIAPKLMGSKALPMARLDTIATMADCIELSIRDTRALGPDVRVIARVTHRHKL